MPKSVSVLFKEFFQICLLRRGPQDLPVSAELFCLVLLAYTAVSTLLSLPTNTLVLAVTSGLIEASLLLLISWLFLYLRSLPGRLLQTATALAGTGFIFSLFALPLFYWGVYFTSDPVVETLISLLVLALMLWNIAVMTHILRHALSSSLILGLFGALTYIALISFALQLIIQGQLTT